MMANKDFFKDGQVWGPQKNHLIEMIFEYP